MRVSEKHSRGSLENLRPPDTHATVDGVVQRVSLELASVPASSPIDALSADGFTSAGIDERPRPEASVLQRPSVEASRQKALAFLMGSDAVAVGVSLIAGQLLEQAAQGWHDPVAAVVSAIYVSIYIPVAGFYGLYHRPQRRLVTSSFPDMGRIIHAVAAAALISLFVSGGFHRWMHGPSMDRTAAALSAVMAVFLIPAARSGIRLAVQSEAHTSRVLIVGTGQVADMVSRRLSKVDDVTVVGCVDDPFSPNEGFIAPGVPTMPWLGAISELAAVAERESVDHIVVAFSAANEAAMAAELRSLPGHVRISVVPRMFDLLTVRSSVDDLRGLPLVDVAPPRPGLADRVVKRTMDVAVSALSLVILSPLLLATALAIKLTSHGPVLFSQVRAGRNGRPFRIHKFRTMYVGAERVKAELTNEVDGPLFKVREDPRVTPLGRFLRRTSLDELPQLINVLIGEMSLVGPRPFVMSESANIEGWAARRFDVRPGMTGLWQVSGRNDLPFAELCRLDYAYVSSWSLWWDLSILWRTPGRVLGRDGAY